MTREEAIKELKILKEDYWDDDSYGHETKQYENTILAIDIAIKTLEKEPILDKIRAEVKKKIVKRPWLDFKDRERDRNDAFLEVLDIIDKYREE